jgi:tetratricopeptide (TPR) repeat protein
VRGALVAAVCAWLAVTDARRVDPRAGVGIDLARYPVRACDVIEARGIRGHGFNNFEYGGYQAWRFWPDRSRLPFIDVHQAGTTLDRRLYVSAFASAEGWRALDDRHHFDYVLLTRAPGTARRLPDVLDADTSWALVFVDDAATLYVRRAGPLAGVAARFGYRYLPGGDARTGPLGEACARDSVLRAAVRAELGRAADASPWNASALSLLSNIDLSEGRYGEARDLLARGLRLQPGLGRAHERLGLIALEEGRSRDALGEFQRERARTPRSARVAVLIGRAWQQLGDLPHARDAYRRAVQLDPADREAQDSLGVIERAMGR